MKNKILQKRQGAVDLIGLLILFLILGIALMFATPAYLRAVDIGGELFGVLVGIIVMTISAATVTWILRWVAAYCFPGEPTHCETGKCFINKCYKVRLATHSVPSRDGSSCEYTFPITYFKCDCGHEYLMDSIKFFAKVNEDGSLKPYKYYNGAWYDDKRVDSDVYDYAIPMNILQELHTKPTESPLLFMNKNNCLELCAHCDCGRSKDVHEPLDRKE
jgi:hypothetical protein